MSLGELLQFVTDERGRLATKFADHPDRANGYSSMVKLMEELGELAEQVLAKQSLQRSDKATKFDSTSLGDEVADVLISTLMLATDLEVDVEKALRHKIAKIEARYAP